MHKIYARVTCVTRNGAFAFGELLKYGEYRDRYVKVMDEDDFDIEEDEDGNAVLVMPEKIKGNLYGYLDGPCSNALRVDEIRMSEPSDGGPPASTAQLVSPIADRIIPALGQLRFDDDSQWTADGLPRAEVVGALVGERVTRGEIEEARPGFNRDVCASEQDIT